MLRKIMYWYIMFLLTLAWLILTQLSDLHWLSQVSDLYPSKYSIKRRTIFPYWGLSRGNLPCCLEKLLEVNFWCGSSRGFPGLSCHLCHRGVRREKLLFKTDATHFSAWNVWKFHLTVLRMKAWIQWEGKFVYIAFVFSMKIYLGDIAEK